MKSKNIKNGCGDSLSVETIQEIISIVQGTPIKRKIRKNRKNLSNGKGNNRNFLILTGCPR
jgi:hypothetical protein